MILGQNMLTHCLVWCTILIATNAKPLPIFQILQNALGGNGQPLVSGSSGHVQGPSAASVGQVNQQHSHLSAVGLSHSGSGGHGQSPALGHNHLHSNSNHNHHHHNHQQQPANVVNFVHGGAIGHGQNAGFGHSGGGNKQVTIFVLGGGGQNQGVGNGHTIGFGHSGGGHVVPVALGGGHHHHGNHLQHQNKGQIPHSEIISVVQAIVNGFGNRGVHQHTPAFVQGVGHAHSNHHHNHNNHAHRSTKPHNHRNKNTRVVYVVPSG